MLQAFIITLREGVEAALIVGITLPYLTKIGRQELRKTVYAALIAAFLGSIGVAVVISRTHLNEDVFEGWVMLVAAFFVITMVIFMMKTGKKMKGEIGGRTGFVAGTIAGFGCFFELDRVDEFFRDPGRGYRGSGLWRDVCERQRTDQSAEIFPGHDSDSVPGGGAVDRRGAA